MTTPPDAELRASSAPIRISVQVPRHTISVRASGTQGPPGPPGEDGGGGSGGSTVIVQTDPPSTFGLPEGTVWVDEDSTVGPSSSGSTVLVQTEPPNAAVYPEGTMWVDEDSNVPIGGGGGGSTVIVQTVPPDPTGLAEGTMWVDEDSVIPEDDSGVDTTWTIVGDTDPGDPSLLDNPFGSSNRPLWVDTDEVIADTPEGDPEWINASLSNDWVTYTSSATVYPPVYRKLAGGLVQLEGAVAPGRTTATIFTLPTGYRPDDGRLIFDVPCDEGTCRVDVLQNGNIVHISGEPGAWLSLSTISFFGETGVEGEGEPGEPPPEEEEDMYGDHLIVWNGTAWVYRGNVVVARPVTIPAYNLGARAVWDTSMYVSITTPPAMAVTGDVWFPHGDVDPLA